jgi:hypothetical protein
MRDVKLDLNAQLAGLVSTGNTASSKARVT